MSDASCSPGTQGPVVLEGGCACHAVRYAATEAAFHATICHCSDCRRSVGAHLVAWFSVSASAFAFVAGRPCAFTSSVGVERTFCGTCGTSLTYRSSRFPDQVDVTIASLEIPSVVSPEDHVHTADRLKWDLIMDHKPTFPHSRLS